MSQALDASLFRYVSFQRLLEVETGITKNEPIQLAIQNAIENAVESLIIEGIEDKLWSTAQGERRNETLVAEYNKTKMEEESTLIYDRTQAKEVFNNGFSIYLSAPVFNGDFSRKTLGFGGGAKYNLYFSPSFDAGVRGDYLYLTGGQDFYRSYATGNMTLGYTILPRDNFTPYIYGGIGVILGIDTSDSSISTSTSAMNYQYGVSLKYNINPNMSIFLSAENNHTNSDAIENVVNGVRDDFYYNFSLGLEWRFGKNLN